MGTRLIERHTEYKNSDQSIKLMVQCPSINWLRLQQIGINHPAPEMTNWKAIQRYIGERRVVINLISKLMQQHKPENDEEKYDNPTYMSLLNQRTRLSSAQRYDRLRLAGKI